MSETQILFFIMGGLALIELGLIIALIKVKTELSKLIKILILFSNELVQIKNKINGAVVDVKSIAGKIGALELIKEGSIKLHANSSMFGDVNIDLDLSKILGEKKEIEDKINDAKK